MMQTSRCSVSPPPNSPAAASSSSQAHARCRRSSSAVAAVDGSPAEGEGSHIYGKFFASTFTGSMLGAGADVFAVWGYVIANTVDSRVELNPRLLGAVLGAPSERVETAIEFLCRPDPASRNEDEDGRRLVREGAFQFRVVSHEIYRAIRNEDERRAYNRDAQRRSRARRSGSPVTPNVNDGQSLSTLSAQAEAEEDLEEETEAKNQRDPPYPPSGGPDEPSSVGGGVKPRRGSKVGLSLCPEVFAPDPTRVSEATAIGFSQAEIDQYTVEFVNYWRGTGRMMREWQRVFSNRMRDLARKLGKAPNGSGAERRPPTAQERKQIDAEVRAQADKRLVEMQEAQRRREQDRAARAAAEQELELECDTAAAPASRASDADLEAVAKLVMADVESP